MTCKYILHFWNTDHSPYSPNLPHVHISKGQNEMPISYCACSQLLYSVHRILLFDHMELAADGPEEAKDVKFSRGLHSDVVKQGQSKEANNPTLRCPRHKTSLSSAIIEQWESVMEHEWVPWAFWLSKCLCLLSVSTARAQLLHFTWFPFNTVLESPGWKCNSTCLKQYFKQIRMVCSNV